MYVRIPVYVQMIYVGNMISVVKNLKKLVEDIFLL